MKVLGIETSCDETAIAVLEIDARNITVLSNVISSQVKLHAQYGGVVPHLAAREHEKNLPHVFEKALEEAKTKIENIDLIAVTMGPGLAPALARGVRFAKEIAEKNNIPLLPVSHLEGHIYSNWLPPLTNPKSEILNSEEIFPALNIIVSGGHTELVLMHDHGKYELIGETLDDAVGEAFDKVARLLELGYPGGPIISKMAEDGDANKYPLPTPMPSLKNLNFSYSGLKTAVLYLVRDLEKPLTEKIKSDICASFQKSALDIIIKKTIKAAEEFNVKTILLSGGVSANKYLRENLSIACAEASVTLMKPHLEYTGDNGAMIAVAGYFNHIHKKNNIKLEEVDIDANMGFSQVLS